MRLTDLGWDDGWDAAWAAFAASASDDGRAPVAANVRPARVAIEFNHNYRVYADDGELEATASGRLKHQARNRAALPAVGDWVAVRQRVDEERGAIVGVLPRRSKFSRRMVGQVTDEQIVAANIDVVFVAMSLDADFSLRRLERYLLMARESGAAAMVLLTKPDLSAEVPAQAAAVGALAGDVPVHVVSPRHSQGLDVVSGALAHGRTGALLGSSGVGKSTLINRLVGADVRKTGEVREGDSKGRHTTMHRELVLLPGGGLMIDTPGMRELQLWDAADAVRGTFDDVEALGGACHFTNCRHVDEPRCAVKAAVEDGRLAADRLDSYRKLQGELTVLAGQRDARALIDRKREDRVASKALRARLRQKRS